MLFRSKFAEEARNASFNRMKERLDKIGARDEVAKFRALFVPAK